MKKAILVEPEIPENTGFIARLAANFDFELRVVNPGFNLEEARKTAAGAQEKLREARIFDSVKEAVEDLEYVVGTKPGKGSSLQEFQPRENTSVMIGRESSGLSNKELEFCDAIVYIETGEYSSINQSHAAAILFHSINTRPGKQGMSENQKQALQDILPQNAVREALIAANPEREKLNAIIGELKELESD